MLLQYTTLQKGHKRTVKANSIIQAWIYLHNHMKLKTDLFHTTDFDTYE